MQMYPPAAGASSMPSGRVVTPRTHSCGHDCPEAATTLSLNTVSDELVAATVSNTVSAGSL